jgi:hypothetical protein
MPIHELVKQHAFAPEEIKVLVTAFEAALQELQLKDRSDPATMLVAKRIIAVRSRGSVTLFGCARRAWNVPDHFGSPPSFVIVLPRCLPRRPAQLS